MPLFVLTLAAVLAQEPVDTAGLLGELTDLARLARLPEPDYRLVQFSSYDRRSVSEEDPAGWFANADGFGGEPIPGFAAVLREPDERGVGEYLVCEVSGPGAIVRGWSAGMGGTLRVELDGAPEPLFTGRADDFLARRSRIWIEQAGLPTTLAEPFIQEDADYFPVPFARGLRVTWEGRLSELHFYHLEVRRYPAGTEVRSFDPARLPALRPWLEEVASRCARPRPAAPAPEVGVEATVAAGAAFEAVRRRGPGALVGLRLRVTAADPAAALRGALLRLDFDGDEPEVLAPVGDFFGTFPGLQPCRSLPLEVGEDGWLSCRFVMPFAREARVALENRSGRELRVEVRAAFAPWDWDERSLHFRADWRQGEPIELPGGRPVDLRFLAAEGNGRIVGVASLLMNPSRIPTPAGSWWGEGDEKIFLDDRSFPAFFGTGSEDYYNYSWSRPDLFAHPCCTQAVNTGPGNAGFVVDQRFHLLDDLRFRRWTEFRMELWPHRQDAPIAYARMVWWYARPGAAADTPPPTAAELRVPELPRWEPDAAYGAADSWIAHFEDLVGDRGRLVPEPLASRGRVWSWPAAAPGAVLEVPFATAAAGRYRLNLVARHLREAGAVRVAVDGRVLALADGGGSETARPGSAVVPLRNRHGVVRLLSLGWEEVELAAGRHTLRIECVEPGPIAFDYLWLKTVEREPVRLPNAVEAESLAATGDAAGGWQVQALGPDWSGGRQLWVRATAPGQRIELTVPPPAPGRYRVKVLLTRSWDYGVLAFALDGRRLADGIDTWSPDTRRLGPIDLGLHELAGPFVLGVEVTGSNPESREPGCYFGIDCVILEPAEDL
ncbi:MAG: DUF2961 domain-containing protein [Planctomycetota bacterium]|nr:MAG: DUF2961 domain-containing protein [Planctomycetota bacterium]